jgi:hypothetical protein
MYVHDRRSLRLNGYDYAQAGAYFVTICTQDRACLFGDVADGEMRLNDAGRMVRSVWEALPDRFPRTGLDAFVVMPNHVHRIIVIAGPCPVVWAGPRACPDHGRTETGPPVGAGLALPEEKGAVDQVRAITRIAPTGQIASMQLPHSYGQGLPCPKRRARQAAPLHWAIWSAPSNPCRRSASIAC